jgi:alpha-L-rhamnosidase
MKIGRRKFLVASGVTAIAAKIPQSLAVSSAPQIAGETEAAGPTSAAPKAWNAQWIWYPGQLAAYRHSRRMRLAMNRCTSVGYPANFRQPLTQAYFRKSATATSDIELRWAGPTARIRTLIGGVGRDITSRHATMHAGQTGIEVQIDFAQTMPCLLLEAGSYSTDSTWEASLDGEHWVRAETSAMAANANGDPGNLPDEPREIIKTLPVVRSIAPQGPPQTAYPVSAGRDALLDFQETELGTLVFEITGQGELTVQVGESLPESRDPDQRYFEQYALPPITLTEQSQRISLPERALRYVRFSTTDRANIKNVHFDASLWPAEEKGRFKSSDTDLNAIWTTAVATLRSNMHDFYLDGIRRDGLIWHDGPLCLDAYERVFFDADLSRQTLIAETLPEHPSVRDIGIIDSQMYDIIGFEREYLVRGDAAFSLMFRERIEDILRFYNSLQDERGFINAANVQPYGFFPDWSATQQTGPDGHGTPAYGQILLSAAFASAARLANAWGDPAAQSRYEASAAQLRKSIRETFWRPQDGLYSNGFNRDGKPDSRTTSFAQAFAVAYDLATPSEHAALFAFLDDESKRPSHFSLSQVVELTAYAKAGRAAQAVRRLKAAWLPIIQAGYRRFFEDITQGKPADQQLAMYNRKYAASLCHAWAGTSPVMAISRGILGIEPIAPGYHAISVSPQPCALDSVRGSVPTPRGPIEIEWRAKQGQQLKGEITLPPETDAYIAQDAILRGPGRFPLVLSH